MQHLPKLLLIDDDRANRLLITEILEGTDITILECRTGKEALELYKEHSENKLLVLLDIKLPDCTGWDLCKQLRAINDSVPVIAMSAITPIELKYNYKAAGFTTYICKPFDMEEFIEVVKYFLFL